MNLQEERLSVSKNQKLLLNSFWFKWVRLIEMHGSEKPFFVSMQILFNLFTYDVWGDTFNLAIRMESSELAEKNISGFYRFFIRVHRLYRW